MPIRRTIKNVVKNYTDAQIKVREATSNDPWGPSSTMMSEIADLTYNVLAYTEIMQMVWKRLNDHGKNWRHVYKSLVLLDYIIKTGSEKVAQQCKENIFSIETLKNFQYVEEGKDHGMNVREKAKQLVQLLKDDERLKNERTKALKAKERFAQNTMGIGSAGQRSEPGSESPPPGSGYSDLSANVSSRPAGENSDEVRNPELEAARPSTAGEEELQLQLALAMSREEAEEEEKRKKSDDLKLQMALEESQRAGDSTGSRHREESNADTLLDLSLGGAAAAAPSAASDPWGSSPAPAPPPAADPWGGSSKPAAADPWGGATSPTTSADPWAPTAASQNSTAMSSDPWGESTTNTATNGSMMMSRGGGGIDDEFDMIGTRSKSPQGAGGGGLTGDLFGGDDILGGGAVKKLSIEKPPAVGANPWEFCQTEEELIAPQQAKSAEMQPSATSTSAPRKTPEMFLGGLVTGLVNLDTLVEKKSDYNPFALTAPTKSREPSPNPFQQAQAQGKGPSVNQLGTTSSQGESNAFGMSMTSGMNQAPSPMFGVSGTSQSPAFGQSMAGGMQPVSGYGGMPSRPSPAFGQPAPMGGFGQQPMMGAFTQPNQMQQPMGGFGQGMGNGQMGGFGNGAPGENPLKGVNSNPFL